MIPEGWHVGRLHDLISSLDSGVSVNSEDRPASDYEIGVLKLSAVSYGLFKARENKKVLADEISRASLNPKKNRIIISRANTPELVGASVYINRDYHNLFLPDLLWQMEPRNESFSMRWLGYLLNSDSYRLKIRQLASGSSMSMIKITKFSLLNLSLNIPPLEEQRKIAEILSTWDKAIELLEQLIAMKRKLKQGLMQQLLTGKRRFKEFEGSEWETVELGSVAKIRRGASPRPIQDPKWFAETGRGWVRIRDLTASNIYLRKTTQYLSKSGVEKSVMVDPGDLIMSICATIGVPRIVGIPACIHDGFVVFRDFEKQIDKFFLYHYISFITSKLSDSGQPGTQRNLNTTIVGSIRVPKFPLEEQKEIASVLSAADTEISTLEKQLSAYKQQKRGLMQQLLTGKKRVASPPSTVFDSGRPLSNYVERGENLA